MFSNKTSRRKFNASHYMVMYDELMKNTEAREVFRKYLKEVAHTEETLLFLNEVDEYTKAYTHLLRGGKQQEVSTFRNCKQIYDQCANLVNTYIMTGSEKELNLGIHSKSLLLRTWESVLVNVDNMFKENANVSKSMIMDVIEKLDPDELFKDVVFSVSLDLRSDQFPRFARCPMIFQFLEKQGELFTRSIAVDISKGFNVDFRFKPKDLTRKTIEDREIFFAFSVMEDSPDWKSYKNSKSQAQLLFSKTQYVFGEDLKNKGMHLYKFVTTYPYPLEESWKCLRHAISQNDPVRNISDITQLDYYFPGEMDPSKLDQHDEAASQTDLAYIYSSCILDLKTPGMKKRFIPHVHTTIYDEGIQGYVTVGRTYSGVEPPPGCLNSDIYMFYYLTKVGESSSRLTHIIYTDFKIPIFVDTISEKAWKKRSLFLEASIANLLENCKDKELDDKFELDLAAKYNLKNFPNRSWYKEYLRMIKPSSFNNK